MLKQLHHLGPVNSDLHTMEQNYSSMAKALDATRHDMAYKRISSCSEGCARSIPCMLYLYNIVTIQMK